MKYHYHCFDLVEDAITALLKGYVPLPRQQPPKKLLHIMDNSVEDFHLNDDYDDRQLQHTSIFMNNTVSTHTQKSVASVLTPAWQDRVLHPWWPFTSWTNHSNDSDIDENENDHRNVATTSTTGHQKQFTKNYAIHHDKPERQLAPILSNMDGERRHWTALDWLDWLEQDQEIKLKEQKLRWLQSSSDSQETTNNVSDSRVIDWLTYVDALNSKDHSNFSHATSTQQSA